MSSHALPIIMELLPGLESCGRCGYAACGQYAAAISTGTAPVESCPLITEEKRSAIREVLTIDRRVAGRYFSRAASGALRGLKEAAMLAARAGGLLIALLPILGALWIVLLAVSMK